MSNLERPGYEPPRGNNLTPEERVNIHTKAGARRRQASLKGEVLALREQAEGGGASGSAYDQKIFDLLSREMSAESQMAMSKEEAADSATLFLSKGQESAHLSPNLAAFHFATAAKLEQHAGRDFSKTLNLAKQYIEQAAAIPKKTPNAFLPEAIIAGVQARQVKLLPEVDSQKVAADIGRVQQLLADYALVLPEKQRENFLRQLPEKQRKKASVLMDRALSPVLKEGLPSEKEEKRQVSLVRQRVTAQLEAALGAAQSDPAPMIKAMTETLYTLGDKESKDLILNLARKASGADKSKQETARIFDLLINLDSHKGNSLAVELLGDKNLPDHVAWLFLKKLIKNGYLDKGLQEYLETAREVRNIAKRKGPEKVEQEKRFLEAIRLIVSELGINPDAEVVKLILNHTEWSKKGERVYDYNLGERVKKIKEQKTKFEKIQDKDELVKLLAKDKQAATVYYVLFGGKTRFALVNSYNSEKFTTILGVLNDLKTHPEPLKEFSQALQRQGVEKKQADEILANLQAGQFPLGGNYAREIRLDVSDSARLESLERQARGVFGSNQLGIVVKLELYRQYLQEQGEVKQLKYLDEANGLADLEKLVTDIESKYPDILDRTENNNQLNKNWRRLGDKNVFSLSLRAVLREGENQVSIRELLANLEVQRKSLLAQHRQKSSEYLKKLADPQVRQEEKAKIQEQVERIEEKGASKLLSYLLAETVGLEKSATTGEADLSPITQKVLSEWESHCEQIFGEYQSLDTAPTAARKERKVTLRYLDKRQDLVEALRFADAAQCCFTSTQYRIEGHEVGNAEWIARIHKDPLSFIFEIEDNQPDSEKRSAIGFVFGSFGLEKGRAPAVLLNGVYMEGKTDTAAQSVVNAIEQDFSRPLKMSRQLVASRHAGTSRYGTEYKNDRQPVRRLRAIVSANTGRPEDQIYDDLSVGVNTEGQTDQNIFSKELK